MKFKDIVYKLRDTEFTPYRMGTVSTEVCDCTVPLKCFINSIKDVEFAVKLCSDFDLNDSIVNLISEEEVPLGFYKKYIHYFIIYVDDDTDITYYPRIAYGQSRHWINGKLAFIGHCEDGRYATVYTITLKKGYNVFCIEHIFDSIPIVRIDIANKTSDDTNAIAKFNYWYKENDFIINQKLSSHSLNEIFDFNIILLDLINLSYDSEAYVHIKCDADDEVLLAQRINLKKEHCLRLGGIEIKDESKYNQLVITVKIIDKNGIETIKYTRFFRCSPDQNYINYLINEASILRLSPTVPQLVKNEIIHHICKLNKTKNDVLYGKYLKDIIDKSYNSNLWTKYLYNPGGHYVYYYSKEDGHYYYYYIVLPPNYDPTQQYPLLLTIHHGHVENLYDSENTNNYSNKFSQMGNVICADIGGRGAALSNYMGDLFLMEEIQHILDNYSIDRKRVYGVGHCAGNHSLLIFAQSHPDIFAGIYLRTTNLYKANMQNMYNISCMYLISSLAQNDPMWNSRCFIKKKIRKFKYICVKDVFNEDIDLTRVQFSYAAIEQLMSNELDEYPRKVYYRTERNRNRKAYFIEIESIQEGKNFAEIYCEWTETQLIVRTKHCSGFKITIPPQIKREKLELCVNGKVFALNGYQKSTISCKYSMGRGFNIVDGISSSICLYKGSGLLDIYFSPLIIYNCIIGDYILDQVARSFSNPVSNAAYKLIYVDYPIRNTIYPKDLMNYSFLIVDDNQTAPDKWILEVRKRLKIQMNKNGYFYNDTFTQGQYCIMQIVQNPWNKQHSILYLNTNNKKLYERNIFTRKVIIPSYIGGLNPYLNGVALLFTGAQYYTIDEWGRGFKQI